MGRSPRTRHVLLFLLPALVAFSARPVAAQPQRPATPDSPDSYVSFHDGRGYFPLVEHGRAAPLVVSGSDHPGVVRVVGDLRDDIERVTGVRPAVARDEVPDARNVVIVGTIGESPLIDGLVASGKLDVGGIAGKWETSLEQVVDDPLPGVRRAFVIAGSDQRGTVYGAYDVSRNMGVSPWYWWDDVPSKQRRAVFVKPGRHTQDTPAVKYRGFFINDENPALNRWAPKMFGPGKAPGYPNGFNHEFYAKIFETMLRLKANYLWPAVWGRAFAEDDPLNHATAKRYGVIMGTSHEAPMMRGIEEWNRHADPAERDENGDIVEPGGDPYGGTGEWSFRRNAGAIKKYWRDGIERMVREDFEGVVTIGMRGNGDTALPDGDGIELMRDIIAAEREIIEDVTGKDASETPQVWTRTVTVHAVVEKPETDNAHGFVEAGGYVSMNAGHYSRASRTSEARWKRVPGIGRTGAGMEPFPVTAPGLEPGKGPRLEYDMTLTTTGPVKVWAYLSPRNSVLSTEGLRYAVSIDGAEPQVANITEATGANATTMNKQWERNTSDNVNRTVTTHTVTEPGVHTLKFWMIDPTVVLQKIVVDTGGLRASYLGPPESRRAGFRSTPTPQGGTKP